MWERAVVGAAIFFAAGCSVIVEGMIPIEEADAGPTVDERDSCNTTQDCLGVSGREVDCHVACVLSEIDGRGHCERSLDETAPDGVFCGTGDEDQICLDGECVERRCGDGYVDRRGPNPEYCDDANANEDDGCFSNCTRLCQLPATDHCPGEDEVIPCRGAVECDDSLEPNVCVVPDPVADGTACTLTDGGPGECEAGACVERRP
jgi:cysteine-rich repeat protein